MKEWKGNRRTAFAQIGASNHSAHERAAGDWYATHPLAARVLVGAEEFSPDVWECACGAGHLSRELERAGYRVFSSDIADRGYGDARIDFLKCWTPPLPDCDIITNPPYSRAEEFIVHALDVVGEGHKVAMFLKLTFLEGQRRKALFEERPPRTIYVSSSRIQCAMNGDFGRYRGSAVAYGWWIWEKGHRGDTVVKWVN